MGLGLELNRDLKKLQKKMCSETRDGIYIPLDFLRVCVCVTIAYMYSGCFSLSFPSPHHLSLFLSMLHTRNIITGDIISLFFSVRVPTVAMPSRETHLVVFFKCAPPCTPTHIWILCYYYYYTRNYLIFC